MQIDCDIPAGNIIVEEIAGDTARLRADLRDTTTDWFYWHFRVRGAAGRVVRFTLDGNVMGARGPAVSEDRGWHWWWLGEAGGDASGFTFAFPEDAAEVHFSLGMPYTQRNLDAFLARHAKSPYLRAGTLCRSRSGRPAELLSVGRLDGNPPHRVLVACRHHACEMMASYALEGLIEAVLADDWLRQHVEFFIVPFVDKDGVEDGDQGKNRAPHDHNRDYGETSIYPEVRALRIKAETWSQGRLRLALDLHCPWIRGEWNEHIHFVGLKEPKPWARAEQFAEVLQGVRQGPLPYRREGNLLWGLAWNTQDEYGPAPSFCHWLNSVPGTDFGVTIEIPYANAQGVEVNADSARAFGRDLAAAVREYLR